MADYDFWALGESALSISGGGSLDNPTGDDGSHLIGLTLTINSWNFEQLYVSEAGNDTSLDDNDGNQTLNGETEFNGTTYSDGTKIEAEYMITLLDPNTGIEYTAIAINVDESTGVQFSSIEGLAFVGELPPVGVALTIVDTQDGPGSGSNDPVEFADITPPCFTPGTLIATPGGLVPVEILQVGDVVLTEDNGPQVLRWVGRTPVTAVQMAGNPAFRPIRISAGAFGNGLPQRDMLVSPQHRVLVQGWRAELLYGEDQVLVAASHLVNDTTITRAWDIDAVVYIHLQFDNHEILHSDGLLSESFNPGPMSVRGLNQSSRNELAELFPDVDLNQAVALTSARTMITRREATALLALAA